MNGNRIAAAIVVAAVGLLAVITVGFAQESKRVQTVLTAPSDRTLAPDFSLKDTTGKVVRLSEYRGRVVLLDFWATTCAGCIQEIPMFVEVSKVYEGRGLATIGVSEDIAYADLKSADEAWDRVRPFVRDRKVNYTVLMGDSRVTADYAIKALPLTYLIDGKGRVAATYLGVVARGNLEANIKSLLAEPR
jgi:cytochrome c biogenesis protein CcmG/thiol:disulfide interchange protein DsbE